jgi:CBS domain containing-hemolysin-like protein
VCLGLAVFLEGASGWFVSRAVDPAASPEQALAQARLAGRSRLLARFWVSVGWVGFVWIVVSPWQLALLLGVIGASFLGAVLLAGTWHSPAALTGRALMRGMGFFGRFLDGFVSLWCKLVRVTLQDAVASAEMWDRELEWLRSQPEEEEADRAVEAIYEFRLSRVEDVMVPREEMVGIPAGATVASAVELVQIEGHSRYPVFEGSLDEVVGVLHVFDLLQADPEDTVRDLARPPLMTAATRSLSSLLKELQVTYNQLAVVADELGGTAGIVTVEDLLEELVGEIEDESDQEESQITRLEDGVFRVDAGMRLEELNQELDLELPEGEYDTVAGLVLEYLERVPKTGEKVQVGNVWIEIIDAEPHRIQEMNVIVGEIPRGPHRSSG